MFNFLSHNNMPFVQLLIYLVFCLLNTEAIKSTIPEFVWGSATSAYQTEGATKKNGRGFK